MSYFSVDIEADGPIPGTDDYSMVSFGAVKITPELDQTFYGQTRPISEKWIPSALAISGHTREEHLTFDDPVEVMTKFETWINETTKGRPILVSDNNGFDYLFIAWYFHHFLGGCPFGHTSRNLSDIYKGMVGNMTARFKHLRDTPHTHHPVDDAKGNAEVLVKLKQKGLKIGLH
jgi:hypothetical protein